MPIAGVVTRDMATLERARRLGGVNGSVHEVIRGDGTHIVVTAFGPNTDSAFTPVTSAIHGHSADAVPVNRPEEAAELAKTHQTAVAVWDSGTERLDVYRSVVGPPPVFYHRTSETLLWATDIASVIALGAPVAIDEIGLAQYQLTGFLQAPRTMYEGISRLPAAHKFTLDPTSFSVARYWAPRTNPKVERSLTDLAEELQELLVGELRGILNTARSPAISLSSGIDSVGLAALSKSIDAPMKSFTFEYGEYSGTFNEAEVASHVAAKLGIPHQTITITPSMVAEQYANKLRTYEEPLSYGLHSAWPELIEFADLDLVITGAIGAHWVPGRAMSAANSLADRFSPNLLRFLRRSAEHLPNSMDGAKTTVDLSCRPLAGRYFSLSQQTAMTPSQARRLQLDPDVTDRAWKDLSDNLSAIVPESLNLGHDDRLAMMGAASFGADHLMHWSHRWAESASLRTRFPLAEVPFVEYMMALRNRQDHIAARRLIASRVLPDELARVPKIAQTIPLDVWLANDLRPWARTILNKDEVESDGHFDWEELSRCMDEHESGVGNHKWCIWTSISYMIWRDAVFGQ